MTLDNSIGQTIVSNITQDTLDGPFAGLLAENPADGAQNAAHSEIVISSSVLTGLQHLRLWATFLTRPDAIPTLRQLGPFAETGMWSPLQCPGTHVGTSPSANRHQRLRSKPSSRLIPALYSSSLDPAILITSSSGLASLHRLHPPRLETAQFTGRSGSASSGDLLALANRLAKSAHPNSTKNRANSPNFRRSGPEIVVVCH
jgi:hypothetical protein